MQSSIIYAEETTMPSLSSLIDPEPSPAILKKTIALMTQQLLQNELVLQTRTRECDELRRETEAMKRSMRTIQVEVDKHISGEKLPHETASSNIVTIDPMEKKRLLRESLLRRPSIHTDSYASSSSTSANPTSEQAAKRMRPSVDVET
jgi:hypothetical protein